MCSLVRSGVPGNKKAQVHSTGWEHECRTATADDRRVQQECSRGLFRLPAFDTRGGIGHQSSLRQPRHHPRHRFQPLQRQAG